MKRVTCDSMHSVIKMGRVLYGSMHLLSNCATDSYTVYQINKNFLCRKMFSVERITSTGYESKIVQTYKSSLLYSIHAKRIHIDIVVNHSFSVSIVSSLSIPSFIVRYLRLTARRSSNSTTPTNQRPKSSRNNQNPGNNHKPQHKTATPLSLQNLTLTLHLLRSSLFPSRILRGLCLVMPLCIKVPDRIIIDKRRRIFTILCPLTCRPAGRSIMSPRSPLLPCSSSISPVRIKARRRTPKRSAAFTQSARWSGSGICCACTAVAAHGVCMRSSLVGVDAMIEIVACALVAVA